MVFHVLHNSSNSHFTKIDNALLRDRSLSLKARGLLTTMLSYADTYDVCIEGLKLHCKDGRDSIQSAYKELKSLSYIKEYIERERGKIINHHVCVSESPRQWPSDYKSFIVQSQTGNPVMVHGQTTPQMENPFVASVQSIPETENPFMVSVRSTPQPEKPQVGKPEVANPQQRNTNRRRTNEEEKIFFSQNFEVEKKWRVLIRTPKWTHKDSASIQENYSLLSQYSPEEQLIMIENAIRGEYPAVVPLKGSHPITENRGTKSVAMKTLQTNDDFFPFQQSRTTSDIPNLKVAKQQWISMVLKIDSNTKIDLMSDRIHFVSVGDGIWNVFVPNEILEIVPENTIIDNYHGIDGFESIVLKRI